MKTTLTIAFILISSLCYANELDMKCQTISIKYECYGNISKTCGKFLVRCENGEVVCYKSPYGDEPMQCKFKQK